MLEQIRKLAEIQKRARVRTLDPEAAGALLADMAAFLADAPAGTAARCGLWSRVASSYRGVPEGTYVFGHKPSSGAPTVIEIRRDRNGFGRRAAIVNAPADWKVCGEGVHASTGACDCLADVRFEKR